MTDNGGGSKVGDFASLQRGITYDGRLVGAPGPALLGLGSIEPGGGFRTGHYKTFGGDCPSKLMLKPGDIYVALKGATKDGSMVGSVAKVPPSVPTGRLTQDTARLDFFRGDKDFHAYLYWVLRTPQYRRYCEERVTGSASASFSRDDFLSYPVVPPSSSAAHIVEVLEAIEAKLELHRFHTRTLEDMAAAIFKAWFIDFEPVKAKAAGAKSFPSLPQSVFDALPSALVASSDPLLGEIPKGWSNASIAELAEYVNGKAFTKFANGRGRMIIRIAELNSGVGGSTQYSDCEAAPENTVNPDDILFSWSGSLGIYRWHSEQAILNQHIFKVIPRSLPRWFVYFQLLEALAEFRLIASNKATTMGHIQRHHLNDAKLAMPPKEMIEAATPVIEPLYSQIHLNMKENRTLAALRDSLLPKLLSGEVRVEAVPDRVGVSANG
jgi:type I restriction enzyme S subunit